jgi:hypothetical protein
MGKANSIKTSIYLYAQPVESVKVAKDEAIMVLGKTPRKIQAGGVMLQQIANAESEADVARCLRAYGPPDFEALPVFGDLPIFALRPQTYRYSLARWRQEQFVIRSFWLGAEGRATGMPADYLTNQGETLRFNERAGELEYYAHDLTSLLHLFMLAHPTRYFKKCINPECPSPYIFATDGKVKLCKPCKGSWNNVRHQRKHRAKLSRQQKKRR